MQSIGRWAAGVVGLAATLLATSVAAFQQQEFRAADGTAYQLLRALAPLGAGADEDRLTTISGSSSGNGGCNTITPSASAIAGVLPPGQALHSFTSIQRTTVLVPNDATVASFDISGAGRLTLGTGGGAIEVCRIAGNCPNGSAALTGLASADANVPAACLAQGLQANCENGNMRNAIAFGLPATNNICNTPANVTVNVPVCAPKPSDGFSLPLNRAIVFVYNGSLSGQGFDVGAGGFGVDTNASNPSCASGGVVSALARLDSNSGLGPLPPSRHVPVASGSALIALAALLGLLGRQHLRRTQRR
ncbi:MAG: hypothetical protein ACRERC_18415 [Candidatus Binatia bacterium]